MLSEGNDGWSSAGRREMKMSHFEASVMSVVGDAAVEECWATMAWAVYCGVCALVGFLFVGEDLNY